MFKSWYNHVDVTFLRSLGAIKIYQKIDRKRYHQKINGLSHTKNWEIASDP